MGIFYDELGGRRNDIDALSSLRKKKDIAFRYEGAKISDEALSEVDEILDAAFPDSRVSADIGTYDKASVRKGVNTFRKNKGLNKEGLFAQYLDVCIADTWEEQKAVAILRNDETGQITKWKTDLQALSRARPELACPYSGTEDPVPS